MTGAGDFIPGEGSVCLSEGSKLRDDGGRQMVLVKDRGVYS